MIDYDKYKGLVPGKWTWVEHAFHDGLAGLYGPNDEEIIVPQCRNEGDDGSAWFEEITEPHKALTEDAPALLNRCLELEEEKAALIHDNEDYVKTASALATENVVLRGTLRDVEILLRAERHNHVTDAAYDDTGSTIANCINIISQALNKAKGDE